MVTRHFPRNLSLRFLAAQSSIISSPSGGAFRGHFTHPRVWGCRGIHFEDTFLTMCKGTSHKEHEQLGNDDSGPLTLGDLGPDMKPQYMSNMVVNEWSLDKDEKRNYELLVMSPTVIERLDYREGQVQFEGRLEPKNVKLSAAMATSAAAVARNMGAYENSTEAFKQLKVVLGLGMDSSLNNKQQKQNSKQKEVVLGGESNMVIPSSLSSGSLLILSTHCFQFHNQTNFLQTDRDFRRDKLQKGKTSMKIFMHLTFTRPRP